MYKNCIAHIYVGYVLSLIHILNENWELSEEDGVDIVRNTGDFIQLSKSEIYNNWPKVYSKQ